MNFNDCLQRNVGDYEEETFAILAKVTSALHSTYRAHSLMLGKMLSRTYT
jgi:hypothetical protein